MHQQLPMADSSETFEEVTYQGKTIKVGDSVRVSHAGKQRAVMVSSIIKKQNHYWVGYEADQYFCPWPLVQFDN